MAAMAPALTDAPAEAHHIRFKLAPPSSALSPASADNSAPNILVASNGVAKRKAAAVSADDFRSQEQQLREAPAGPPALGKLQPLVASYLCSDVTPVPSTKESLELQGVLIKTRGLLPGSLFNGGDFLLRKRQALELRGLAGGAEGQPMAPVNGFAKKLSAGTPAVNGDRPLADRNVRPTGPPPSRSGVPPAARTISRKQMKSCTVALSHIVVGNDLRPQPLPATPMVARKSPSPATLPPQRPEDKRDPLSSEVAASARALSPAPRAPCGGLDARVRERTAQSQARQGEIEGRLRRLRKRLQVVQAKQVERHVQQQLAGLLGRRGGEDALGRLLRGGGGGGELERLYLSGTATLRSAESAFDSDGTESSSGGDSDLEEEQLARADVHQHHVQIWKRAEGRYTVERASIISHWNWLQAHISDLEYRIRQQTDVYRQIRAGKGGVELGGEAPSGVPSGGGVEVKAEPECFHVSKGRAPEERPPSPRCRRSSVNGVLSRVPESAGPEQRPNGSPSPPDAGCVAARTRPLLSYRRRRLVLPHAVPNLNSKKSTGLVCPCRVNPSCVTCGGRFAPPDDIQHECPLQERLSQLDPSVHPILSFSDDVPMSLHLQGLMRRQWQGKAPDKSKPLKRPTLKHKPPLGGRHAHAPSSSSSKDKYKLSNLHGASVRLAHCKSRAERTHRHQADGPFKSHERGPGRKRTREHALDRMDPGPKLFVDAGSPCPSLVSLHSSTHSPLLRQLSTSSESAALLGFNSLSVPNTPQPIRRRRGESSFDINNIVIPMSVAATTRVEKLQYKEILTPNWREVDIFAQPIAEEEDNVEIEDLSDAAFTQQHLPCQEQERSRWTWMALAPAKRRGSRSYKSVDGRTTPQLGTNPPTPQPSSPDPGPCPLLQDYAHLASPLSPPSPDGTSNPYTPCSRDSHRLHSSEDTRCSTPDFTFEERTVAPWERRNFPMEEDPVLEPDSLAAEEDEDMFRMRRAAAYGRSESESEAYPAGPSGAE